MANLNFTFLQNNKNNHETNNHQKPPKREKRDEGNEKKVKKTKTDKPAKVNDKSNDKNPHTSGVKRKLEDGECDPDPSENKRHER